MLVQICNAALRFSLEHWRLTGRVRRPVETLSDAFDLLEAVVERHLPHATLGPAMEGVSDAR